MPAGWPFAGHPNSPGAFVDVPRYVFREAGGSRSASDRRHNVFAKPWESQAKDEVIEEAKQDAAKKPWEKQVPKTSKKVVETVVDELHLPAIDQIKAQAFAKNYLIDFNHRNAAIRTFNYSDGSAETARKVGLRLLSHPYVLQAIHAFMPEIEKEKLVTRERVILGLLEEANYHGFGASHSARVAAWSKLAVLLGMEFEAKNPKNPDPSMNRGGVMLVPYVETVEEWEQLAIASQTKLKADVRA